MGGFSIKGGQSVGGFLIGGFYIIGGQSVTTGGF